MGNYISISIRLDQETVSRLNAIVEPAREVQGFTVDRATLIRQAILRSLPEMEKEFGVVRRKRVKADDGGTP